MADDSLIREALAESERQRRRRRARRVRRVRWTDLDKELAAQALAEIAGEKGSDE